MKKKKFKFPPFTFFPFPRPLFLGKRDGEGEEGGGLLFQAAGWTLLPSLSGFILRQANREKPPSLPNQLWLHYYTKLRDEATPPAAGLPEPGFGVVSRGFLVPPPLPLRHLRTASGLAQHNGRRTCHSLPPPLVCVVDAAAAYDEEEGGSRGGEGEEGKGGVMAA